MVFRNFTLIICFLAAVISPEARCDSSRADVASLIRQCRDELNHQGPAFWRNGDAGGLLKTLAPLQAGTATASVEAKLGDIDEAIALNIAAQFERDVSDSAIRDAVKNLVIAKLLYFPAESGSDARQLADDIESRYFGESRHGYRKEAQGLIAEGIQNARQEWIQRRGQPLAAKNVADAILNFAWTPSTGFQQSCLSNSRGETHVNMENLLADFLNANPQYRHIFLTPSFRKNIFDIERNYEHYCSGLAALGNEAMFRRIGFNALTREKDYSGAITDAFAEARDELEDHLRTLVRRRISVAAAGAAGEGPATRATLSQRTVLSVRINASLEALLKERPELVATALLEPDLDRAAASRLVCQRIRSLQDAGFRRGLAGAAVAIAAGVLGGPILGLEAASVTGVAFTYNNGQEQLRQLRTSVVLKTTHQGRAQGAALVQDAKTITARIEQNNTETTVAAGAAVVLPVAIPLVAKPVGSLLSRALPKAASTVATSISAGLAPGATNAERIAFAELLLGRKLTLPQQQALIRSHEVGMNAAGADGTAAGIGNYTDAQKVAKGLILMKNGFTRTETQLLGDKGVIGISLWPKTITQIKGGVPFSEVNLANPSFQVLGQTAITREEAVSLAKWSSQSIGIKDGIKYQTRASRCLNDVYDLLTSLKGNPSFDINKAKVLWLQKESGPSYFHVVIVYEKNGAQYLLSPSEQRKMIGSVFDDWVVPLDVVKYGQRIKDVYGQQDRIVSVAVIPAKDYVKNGYPGFGEQYKNLTSLSNVSLTKKPLTKEIMRQRQKDKSYRYPAYDFNALFSKLTTHGEVP